MLANLNAEHECCGETKQLLRSRIADLEARLAVFEKKQLHNDYVFQNLFDLNEKGKALLHTAAMNDNVFEIEALISAGADVNVTDSHGYTPLHSAARYGNLAAVEALIRAKADVNATCRSNNGCTPLHRCAFFGHTAVMEALIAAHADVNVTEKKMNRIPLHYAATFGQAAAAEALIAAGADVDALDSMGRTPLKVVVTLDSAAHGTRIDCMKVLIAAGAAPVELSFEEREGMRGSELRLLKETDRLL